MKQENNIILTKATILACALVVNGFAPAWPDAMTEDEYLEMTNHRLVVANMTADLRAFRLCSEQAEMLAEQTAAFGILGLMTTVAAVGIDTATEHPPVAIGSDFFPDTAGRAALIKVQAK